MSNPWEPDVPVPHRSDKEIFHECSLKFDGFINGDGYEDVRGNHVQGLRTLSSRALIEYSSNKLNKIFVRNDPAGGTISAQVKSGNIASNTYIEFLFRKSIPSNEAMGYSWSVSGIFITTRNPDSTFTRRMRIGSAAFSSYINSHNIIVDTWGVPFADGWVKGILQQTFTHGSKSLVLVDGNAPSKHSLPGNVGYADSLIINTEVNIGTTSILRQPSPITIGKQDISWMVDQNGLHISSRWQAAGHWSARERDFKEMMTGVACLVLNVDKFGDNEVPVYKKIFSDCATEKTLQKYWGTFNLNESIDVLSKTMKDYSIDDEGTSQSLGLQSRWIHLIGEKSLHSYAVSLTVDYLDSSVSDISGSRFVWLKREDGTLLLAYLFPTDMRQANSGSGAVTIKIDTSS